MEEEIINDDELENDPEENEEEDDTEEEEDESAETIDVKPAADKKPVKGNKGTELFKKAIENYLTERALMDPLFKEKFVSEKKNLDDCITYIFNTVQKSGCNGFTDEEVFGMAVHYYLEDDIDIGKPMQCHVAVNHKIEITEEEKAEAKERAVREIIDEQKRKMTQKKPEEKKARMKVVKDDAKLQEIISGDIKPEPKKGTIVEQTLF